jgi:glycosyltransferase involved in cell wall biosynthesis
MKVLLAVHQFFPDFSAGTEVLTLSVARELRARGHLVRIFTGFPGAAGLADDQRFDEYRFDGFHVHRFHHAYASMGGQRSLIAIGYDNHLAAAYFSRMLKDFAPDLVHFFHLNRLGTGLITVACQAEVPAFLTPTDFWCVCPTGQLRLWDMRPCAGPTADAGNCIQHFAWNTLGRWGGQLAVRVPGRLWGLIGRLTRSGRLGGYPHAAEVRALSERLDRSVERLNQLQRILVPNAMMEGVLIAHGVAPERLTRVAFGIAGDDGPRPAHRHRRREPLRIGFVGSMLPHKGCHILIEAFCNLPAGRAVLELYGRESDDPAYAARLRRLAAGREAVRFRGVFANERIGEVLGEFDALAVPSTWNENTPLVVYSAQSACCPVIASDVPGLAAAIRDGVDGLLFEAGNPAALATVLRRLLDEPGLVGDLSANARAPRSTADYVDDLLAIWHEAGR